MTNYKLTKKDFQQMNLRSLLTFQLGWNYERMQGSSYLYMILPQLRKMYGDGTDELKTIMKTHAQFFNTSNFLHNIIVGIDLALEENEGLAAKDTVAGIKTGLMGSFAAVGDAIFGATVPMIMGGIAAAMAVNDKSPLGVFLWVAVCVAIMVFRWNQMRIAYKQGTKLVTTMSHQLSALTDAASLLGVFMTGALIATMINFKFTWAPTFGSVTVDVQSKIFDAIFPKLVPAIFAGVIYWLLGRKGMNSTKAILLVIIFAILVSLISFLTGVPILGV